MRLAFVASEVAPYAKTGGLGDVVGALPAALAKLGHHVTVVLPLYAAAKGRFEEEGPAVDVVGKIGDTAIEGQARRARVGQSGVEVFLLDQPRYFDRPGIYQQDNQDYPDNCARFTWLCRASLNLFDRLQQPIDCIHAHDWQTGLLPVLLEKEFRHRPAFRTTGTVFTIHNLAFQGVFPSKQWVQTGLSEELLSEEGAGWYGQFSMMKAGIRFANQITTVSETYAKEIQKSEFGYGLEPLLVQRSDSLQGIVNGIDYESWNPATDPALATNFNDQTWIEGKRACKEALRRRLRLPQDKNVPLFGFVTRLTDQKGLDLIEECGASFFDTPFQFVALGTGSTHYEEYLRNLQRRFPNQCAVEIDFDEQLAREIYAGSDGFLMPSRFEPCGLSQLYSLRYGTLPIVREVGGLADTVIDASPRNLAANQATGFSFLHYAPIALKTAIKRAVQTFGKPALWREMVERAMQQDWSWTKSAHHYADLYKRIHEEMTAGDDSGRNG